MENFRQTYRITGLQQSQSHLGGIVGSQDGVGGTSSGGVLSRSADNCCESGHGDKAVNVSAQINLHHVTVLQQRIYLAADRRIVAHTVVHGQTCGEGDASLHLLIFFVELECIESKWA